MWKLISLAGCILIAAPVFGQQGRGTISGTVTDPTGAGVPGAWVTVINTGTNFTFRTSTRDSGSFVAPAMPVGDYNVTVEKQGFRKVLRSGITLQVDQNAVIDARLDVGSTAETIEVSAEAPLVETGSATIGKVVENRRIAELPLNGRNALALALLAPAVKSQAGSTNSGFADRGIALSAISINGGPNSLNSFVIDGGNGNTAYLADINVNPTVDAVEEFKVQSNVMSSEFGFTAGGVINIVTKSGTNTVHGALNYFVRNSAFDARNAFATTVEPFRYNQYGGAIGGPVRIPKVYDGRNKTFFFYNYEGWDYSRNRSNIISVPIVPQRTGNFSELRDSRGVLIPIYDPLTTQANPNGPGFVRTQFPGNTLPANRLDPVSAKMMQFWPEPNRPPTDPFTNSNNWIGQVSENRDMRQWVTKVDHKLGQNNSLSVRYNYYKHFNDNGYASSLPDPNVRQRVDNLTNRNGLVTDTHTFTPSLLNEFRIGITRQYFPFQAFSFEKDWPARLGLPPSVPGFTLPRVSNGLPGFGAFTVGLRGSLTWQIFDAITWIKGRQTLKVGIDHRLQRANNYQRETPSGQFNFAGGLTGNPQAPAGTGSSFATFLLGSVSDATQIAYGGESQVAFSTSLFVQDDVKVSRRLTLNLGVRWDYQQWPRERNGGTSNFNPFATNTLTNLPGRMEYQRKDYGETPLKPVYSAFAPRVGFAYDLLGNGKTVLRGGYAIFYPTTFYRDFFGNTAGFANTGTTYLPPGGNSNFPAFQFSQGYPTPYTQPLGAALGQSAFISQGVTWEQSYEKVPMSQQWGLSLQRQFSKTWMGEASYTANKASHLVAGGYDLNQLDPQYLSLGLALGENVPNPYAGRVPGALGGATLTRSQSLRPFPYYTGITVRNPHLGNSVYHALLASMEKRLSGGFALLASYTLGKLISDSAVTPINFGGVDSGVGVVGYQNGKYNRRAERGVDPTDVSQRLVMSSIYELPFGKGKMFAPSNKLADRIIGGWQLNGIATLQGGQPLVIRGASNNLADRPNSTGVSAKLDNPTAAMWFDTTQFVNPALYTFGNIGRTLPDVRSPRTVNLDLSIIKDTRIMEKLRAQFRAEAFNVFNHVNLGGPNQSFSAGADGKNRSATFGTITSSRDPRILQLGLRLVW